MLHYIKPKSPSFYIALFAFISFFSVSAFAQNFRLPKIIEKSKNSIVPILSFDSSFGGKINTGTGIVIGDKLLKKEYILTCKHVVSIKDSTGKTIRFPQNTYANFNLRNDSILRVPLKVVYADEINDFAILEYTLPKNYSLKDTLLEIILTIYPFDKVDTSQTLKEGDPLLYIGYPMSMGIGKKSYPLSRTGILAQNLEHSNTFLMDGFVQGGSSGSPVFRIKEKNYLLSGIAQSYPIELADINYKKAKEKDRVAIINPGFTNVLKIDLISQVLISKFGFSK